MTGPAILTRSLDRSCLRHADRVAVRDPESDTSITYAELAMTADRLRDHLVDLGVRPGDRVGLHMRKSVDSIISILGVLKTGAAYVPVDPEAPASRAAYIFGDCSVRVIIIDAALGPALEEALRAQGIPPPMLRLPEGAAPTRVWNALEAAGPRIGVPVTDADSSPDDLAYILYTSGSTGRPKGVRLTHRAASSFVGWCESEFSPTVRDVYASHAPLHFDLSIHDIFVPLARGAKLVLISEDLGRDPLRLAEAIAAERISVWYSTPSILNLLALYGRLERHDHSALRLVLFAGEVFPIPQLLRLKERWPHPRYYNLYGPTETNVCTYFEIPAVIPPDRADPFPIGRMCPPLRGRVIDTAGDPVERGCEGELIVSGPGVMDGYWNLPEQDARAFVMESDGTRWYRTGDLVVEDEDSNYVFHGRRDRMVKRHGYRIELGEIEAGLAGHPAIREVAVIAVSGPDHTLRIKACLAVDDDCRPSIIALKQFSVDRLPRYMVPDAFEFHKVLPRTSTDKIDYQSLMADD